MKVYTQTEKRVVLEMTEAEADKLVQVFNKISECYANSLAGDSEAWSETDYDNAGDIGYFLKIAMLERNIVQSR